MDLVKRERRTLGPVPEASPAWHPHTLLPPPEALAGQMPADGTVTALEFPGVIPPAVGQVPLSLFGRELRVEVLVAVAGGVCDLQVVVGVAAAAVLRDLVIDLRTQLIRPGQVRPRVETSPPLGIDLELTDAAFPAVLVTDTASPRVRRSRARPLPARNRVRDLDGLEVVHDSLNLPVLTSVVRCGFPGKGTLLVAIEAPSPDVGALAPI